MSRSLRRTVGAAVGVVTLLGAVVASPTSASATDSARSHYTVVPACAPAKAGQMSCLALQRVLVSSQTTGAATTTRVLASNSAARHTTAPTALPTGPNGGLTPADLATAYDERPATTVTQTVAIVDAYDDPNLLSDLNTFDAYYGFAAETATSFRKVSQTGTTVLPTPDHTGWAAEETLDAEAVRSMCRRCSIVVVEATSSLASDLGAAVNEAVALGANEVSTSYGEAEGSADQSPAIDNDYNHPGVVITAGTGDDGYYDWDYANYGYSSTPPPLGTPTASSGAPQVPAALNTVVAVGATSLQLNDDGTRSGESVWNENDPIDRTGSALAAPQGATGGGCSTEFAAPLWQSSVANYASAGCGGKRLAADVSIFGDPSIGFDIYDSYPSTTAPACTPPACWYTYGGTSLSSPLIAAIWALVGGSGGVPYPAISLYGHFQSTPGTLNDVTVGGNGYCDGISTAKCGYGFDNDSANTTAAGLLDCAWSDTSGTVAVGTRACEAATGYDGPSGVGTPIGAKPFRALNPTAVITNASTITHAKTTTLSASASTDPFPGGTITAYHWYFGDHTPGSTAAAPAHTYSKAGQYTVTLTVTDNYGRATTVTKVITVR